MKFCCKLNNYQFGSYPFNTLHKFITKNEKIDKYHKYIELEAEDAEDIKWIQFVNNHLSGSNYGKKETIIKKDVKKEHKNGI